MAIKTSSVYKIPADKYNKLLAGALKQIESFKQPEWVAFVKTGLSRKRPSQEKDFWYKRAASILRQIYINKVVGVNRLRTRYGGRYNRGMRPERFRKASGKIIRVILQQAEVEGFLEKYNEPGIRAGRRLTEKGKEFLENIKEGAVQVSEKVKIDEKPQISDNKLNDNQESVDGIEYKGEDNKPELEEIKQDIEQEKEPRSEISESDNKIIEKDIDKAEKEIAKDVAEGATKQEIKEEIKEDVAEAKEEIKEDIEENTEDNK